MNIHIDELIRSKRKTISLTVDHNGKLIIRAPFKTPIEYIKKVVEEKSKWIFTKQEFIKRNMSCLQKKQYTEGEEFFYLGKSYSLKYVSGNYTGIIENTLVLPYIQIDKAEQAICKWYKKEALRVITERVKYYSEITGIKHSSIKVTNARRRWGSCNSKNGLCFTWRLVMAPLETIDYVVVHELSHVIHKNHSSSFWAEVKSIMPDYELHKKWLSKKQFILDLF